MYASVIRGSVGNPAIQHVQLAIGPFSAALWHGQKSGFVVQGAGQFAIIYLSFNAAVIGKLGISSVTMTTHATGID